jgi:hypothetical protein
VHKLAEDKNKELSDHLFKIAQMEKNENGNIEKEIA